MIDEINHDSLMAGNDYPDTNAILEAEKTAQTEVQTKTDSSPTPKEDPSDWLKREFEYAANGKQVKEPLEMILKRASQGYDYAQKMGEFNALQKKYGELETNYKRFEHLHQIDEYARQNPKWLEFVKENWEKRDALNSNIDPNDPMFNFFDSKFRQLNETFGTLNSEISSLKQEKLQAEQAKEDAALDGEIQDIRKQYSYLPWDSVDDFGRNLEARVVEHAAKNGIKSFKTAFRDLYHDEIVKRAEDKAKENLADKRLANKRAGFISESKTPTLGKRAKSIRDSSWEDLVQLGIEDMNKSN